MKHLTHYFLLLLCFLLISWGASSAFSQGILIDTSHHSADQITVSTFNWENDRLRSNYQADRKKGIHDRYFTEGLHATIYAKPFRCWRKTKIGSQYEKWRERHRQANRTFFRENFPTQALPSPEIMEMKLNGIGLAQNIYTPADVETDSILLTDRPYFGWLHLDYYNTRINFTDGRKTTTTFSMGIQGKDAAGEEVQTFIHALINGRVPTGWVHQQKTSLSLQYKVRKEQTIRPLTIMHPGSSKRRKRDFVRFSIAEELNIGTVFTDVGLQGSVFIGLTGDAFHNRFTEIFAPGIQAMPSNEAPITEDQPPPKISDDFFSIDRKKCGVLLYGRVLGRGVLYNSGLSGNPVFRAEHPHTFTTQEVNPLYGQFEVGLFGFWDGFAIQYQQFLRSPEFNGADWHYWGGVSIMTFLAKKS